MEETIGYLLRKVAIRYRYFLHKQLNKDQRNVGKDLVIYHLSKREGLTQNDVVEKLQVKASSVSSIIDQMEKDSLIIKVQDKKDRRKFRLSLSRKGQDLIQPVINSWNDIQEQITFGFNFEEKQMFYSLLERVAKNLDNLIEQNC
ncbi:MAG: MarR family winged helix-turn-helix transcriptional regulator [Promethearchaeota archaeon]